MSQQCECKCGYRCGGPGRCSLDPLECLRQRQGHFVKDCGHKWGGWQQFETDWGGLIGTTICELCGMTSISHDAAVGP